ncbi:MAG TPA: Gfo/Idh/MocA family oxidoreductase [Longimicrobium sp.]|nr:Gfo/Idh/MocA family oxidoreductase [Longimicrobium sp.]
MTVLRAALIGCGKIGSGFADDPRMRGDVFTHAEAYARSARTELVAVCDAGPDAAAACGARWNAPAFTSVGEMLERTRPEVVSVCTPDATHAAVLREVLAHPRAPRAVLCEKPLATELAQAEALVAEARARGVVLAVAYMRRHARNLQALRGWMRDGGMGEVRGVSGWYGKGTLHNGSHWFDLLRMLAGEVRWVRAVDTLGEGGADPTLDVLLGMENGALATLRATDASAFTVFEMDVMGSAGRALVTDSGHRIDVFRAGDSPRYSGYTELLSQAREFGDRRDPMLHAVDDLAQALETGRPPACTGEDGVAALRIGVAALEAARTGGAVSL